MISNVDIENLENFVEWAPLMRKETVKIQNYLENECSDNLVSQARDMLFVTSKSKCVQNILNELLKNLEIQFKMTKLDLQGLRSMSPAKGTDYFLDPSRFSALKLLDPFSSELWNQDQVFDCRIDLQKEEEIFLDKLKLFSNERVLRLQQLLTQSNCLKEYLDNLEILTRNNEQEIAVLSKNYQKLFLKYQERVNIEEAHDVQNQFHISMQDKLTLNWINEFKEQCKALELNVTKSKEEELKRCKDAVDEIRRTYEHLLNSNLTEWRSLKGLKLRKESNCLFWMDKYSKDSAKNMQELEKLREESQNLKIELTILDDKLRKQNDEYSRIYEIREEEVNKFTEKLRIIRLPKIQNWWRNLCKAIKDNTVETSFSGTEIGKVSNHSLHVKKKKRKLPGVKAKRKSGENRN